jgi:DNA-binding CsgD family transcriptional regulator/PAS domain-containing protein
LIVTPKYFSTVSQFLSDFRFFQGGEPYRTARFRSKELGGGHDVVLSRGRRICGELRFAFLSLFGLSAVRFYEIANKLGLPDRQEHIKAVGEMSMDDLIELIYQSAYTPELWPRVMEGLAKSLGAETANLLYVDKTCAGGPITNSEFGFEAGQIKQYREYFRTVDCRLLELRKLPAGGVLADDHNFDFERFIETEIYQDFWKPWGLGRALSGVILHDNLRISAISIRRGTDGGSFSDRDLRVFQQMLRHIQRSLHFENHLNRARLKANALAFAVDQFRVAVFLLDRYCVVIDHNRAAGELLADPQASIAIRDHKLVAYRSLDRQELQEAVRMTADSLHDLEVLPRFLRLALLDGARVLTFQPVPVPLVPTTCSPLGGPKDLVLLFCRETAMSLVDSSRLQRQFGFTPAESKLAAAIAEGATLEEFSMRRRVSLNTARTQLKSAMNKADVHTQAQLVGVVLRSLAAVVGGKRKTRQKGVKRIVRQPNAQDEPVACE